MQYIISKRYSPELEKFCPVSNLRPKSVLKLLPAPINHCTLQLSRSGRKNGSVREGGRKISGENMASHCERGKERGSEEEEDTCENVTAYSYFLENKL